MKAYNVATVTSAGEISRRRDSVSKKQALYRARVLKDEGHTAVLFPAEWSDEKLKAKIFAKAKRNPSESPRAKRMRKLAAVVAKAAAGSAYNKAKRKPRKLQYIARGTSKAASNAFFKTAKKLKLNPSQRDVGKAEELLAGFTGHGATRATKVPVKPMTTAIAVGKLSGVMYEATRDGETEQYFHRFKNSSRPLLIANNDGSSIGIVGGRYRFTDRGIVDT